MIRHLFISTALLAPVVVGFYAAVVRQFIGPVILTDQRGRPIGVRSHRRGFGS